MDQCVDHNRITIRPDVGELSSGLADFCRKLRKEFNKHSPSPESVKQLREEACRFQRRPSANELRFMLVCNVLLDLCLHGWSLSSNGSGDLSLAAPVDSMQSPEQLKEKIRQRHLRERDAQLREPSVQKFIKGMERRRLTPKGWHSIYSVMRDGEELAASIRKAASQPTAERCLAELKTAVDPYVQVVTPTGVCSETGLKLKDIWRYFRHTWVNVYRSIPGRSMMLLIRDRARPQHPVIGIAALGSSVVQQALRDDWIGWSPEGADALIASCADRQTVRWLDHQLDAQIKSLYVSDLLREGIVTRSEVNHPTLEAIKRLRETAEKYIKLHRRYPEASTHKSSKKKLTKKHWCAMAMTNLFKSKRCKQLALLLSVRRIFQSKALVRLPTRDLPKVLAESQVRNSIRQLVRLGKAERVGICMMDITVCGAVAPYNPLLGGKLVCLLLCSPDTVHAYAKRYREQVSVIASSMKGKRVTREPKLVLLCTTSLYGHGSSQYNRIKIPADAFGGKASDTLRYEELGTSEGFGSFQFSKESLRMVDALLGRSSNGRKVNSIFGEGVNPLMRKIREALSSVNLPPTVLLKHGNKRIVYGIALARNFREVLLGTDVRAHYIVPQAPAAGGSKLLVEYWMRRWLSKRVLNAEVLAEVARHSLAYPIHHGAQVPIPGDQEPGLYRAMAASEIAS